MFNRSKPISAVSFFAFQDIITGVTGVMLILVLFLAARVLLFPDEKSASPEPRPEPESRDAAFFHLEETRLRRELDALRDNIRSAGAEQARRERAAALRAARKRLQERAERLAGELAALPDEPAEPAEVAAPEDGASAYRVLAELRAEKRRLEQRYLAARYLPVLPAAHAGRKTILLECRRRDFRLTLPGRPAVLLGAGAALPLPAARRELFERLRGLPVGSYWLAVAVRPAAGAYITMLLDSVREEFPGLVLSAEPLASDDGEAPRIAE